MDRKKELNWSRWTVLKNWALKIWGWLHRSTPFWWPADHILWLGLLMLVCPLLAKIRTLAVYLGSDGALGSLRQNTQLVTLSYGLLCRGLNYFSHFILHWLMFYCFHDNSPQNVTVDLPPVFNQPIQYQQVTEELHIQKKTALLVHNVYI